jgi:hypothetical protein
MSGIIVLILLLIFCGKNNGNDPVSVEDKYKNVKVDIVKELYDE